MVEEFKQGLAISDKILLSKAEWSKLFEAKLLSKVQALYCTSSKCTNRKTTPRMGGLSGVQNPNPGWKFGEE